jgi:uncharacterized membrane protein
MWFLYFSILSFSLCYMVVASYIFSPVRSFFLVKFPFIGRLLSCVQCFGFWSGVIVYLLSISGLIDRRFTSPDDFSHYIVIEAFLYGLASSLISVIINSVIFFLNRRDTYIISKNQNEDDENS